MFVFLATLTDFCFVLLGDTLIFVWRLFCSFLRTISLHVYWLFFVRFSLSVLPPLPSYCRCYSYYVLFLRVMKLLLVLYNIAIYFTDCFASVFTALWVCKCVPNLLISVFLFPCSVYLYYILFLYSIKHDYHHCSFCLYWFAFAFFTISATHGLFYFIIYKYISVFYLTLRKQFRIWCDSLSFSGFFSLTL